mgnify:CR=1 FL=1
MASETRISKVFLAICAGFLALAAPARAEINAQEGNQRSFIRWLRDRTLALKPKA